MLTESQSKPNRKLVIMVGLVGGSVGIALSFIFEQWPEGVPFFLAGLVGFVVMSVLFSPLVSKIHLDLFAPYFLFPLIWIAAVGVSSLRLTVFQTPWGVSMWLSVGLALLAYVMGMFTVFVLRRRWSVERHGLKNLSYQWSERRLKWAALALLTVSTISLAYEYKLGGGVPLLSSQIELVRFDVIVSGYIDTLAVSARIGVMVLGIHLLTKPRFRLRENLLSSVLIVLSLILMASTARRGTVVFPLVVLSVGYHYLKRNFDLGKLVVVGSVGFLAIALFSHYRYVRTFGVEPLRNAWRPEKLVWMTLGYMTISDNFRTLRLLTETIPARIPFQMGRFTTYGLYSILPGHQENMGEFQNRIWGWERYSGSVSTYLGPFYVDFGLAGVVIGSFLIGVLAMFLYNRMLSRPSPYTVLLYSYMAYCLMFMTFSNPFTWTLTYWDIIVFALINVYAKKGKLSARYDCSVPSEQSRCRLRV